MSQSEASTSRFQLPLTVTGSKLIRPKMSPCHPQPQPLPGRCARPTVGLNANKRVTTTRDQPLLCNPRPKPGIRESKMKDPGGADLEIIRVKEMSGQAVRASSFPSPTTQADGQTGMRTQSPDTHRCLAQKCDQSLFERRTGSKLKTPPRSWTRVLCLVPPTLLHSADEECRGEKEDGS